ncbi:MAG: ribulose-phosphate 3-epimerase, partial [Bdellovibrionales bacterium]|nr:ribulose-phosphate 3-epimerase [Bdellovibrionales bacterium]
MKKIAPSILSADFANLEKEIKAVTEAGADLIHVDVMDGHFVPNITIGVPVVASLKKISTIPLDVHLMIDQPEKYVDAFLKAGSDYLTIHIESTNQAEELLKKIQLTAKSGITLRPGTKVQSLEPYLAFADLVLVMTVEPGFGGQSFM